MPLFLERKAKFWHLTAFCFSPRGAKEAPFLIASFDAPSVQILVFCQASPRDLPEFLNFFREILVGLPDKNRYLDRWGIKVGNKKWTPPAFLPFISIFLD